MTRLRHPLIALGLLAPAACSTATPPTAHRATTAVSDPPTSGAPAEGAADPSTVAPSTTTEPEPEPTTTVVSVTVPATSAPRRSTTTVTLYEPPSPQGRSTRQGTGRCGGDLPPCSVMERESGGDPTAIGYGQCGRDDCYGKWQIDPDTAESVGYPRRLDLQPESVQDDAARAILARDGCGAWSTC